MKAYPKFVNKLGFSMALMLANYAHGLCDIADQKNILGVGQS